MTPRKIVGAALLSVCVVGTGGVQAQTSQREQERSTAQSGEARGAMERGAQRETSEIRSIARDASELFRRFQQSQRIPDDQLRAAKCIAVIPNITKVAVVVGGRHGDGLVSCKSGANWSRPAPIDLTGASIGAQLGGKSSDMVLLLKSDNAKQQISRGNLSLGADASVALWTKDRKEMGGEVSTDDAEVIAFTDERGLFAGAALNGAQLKIDRDEVRNLYGREMPNEQILSSTDRAGIPQEVQQFIDVLPQTS